MLIARTVIRDPKRVAKVHAEGSDFLAQRVGRGPVAGGWGFGATLPELRSSLLHRRLGRGGRTE